ncbi:hypothetical protein BKA69DRAFT_1126271 [Paraphysoderma sedebokerense]|nr:hypothetical protein BKA69DRAFT_1126271 [Paraphysoderma sedebokerense]
MTSHAVKDTTWNQHNGVGAVLLGNWFEERTVGAEKILKERDVKFVSKFGHTDILVQDKHENLREKFTTVAKASYQPTIQSQSLDRTPEKVKTIKERQWATEAVANLTPSPPPQSTPNLWTSVTRQDFHASGSHSPISLLQKNSALNASADYPTPSLPVPKEPITFWSQQLTQGATTVYCSIPRHAKFDPTERKIIRGIPSAGVNDVESKNDPVKFIKNTKFSTPIEQYKEGANKE